MVTLTIGSAQLEMKGRAAIDEGWITQQVNRRRDDGQEVCVRVRIDVGGLDLSLASAGCGRGGGGGSPLTQEQQRIFDLWLERGLGSKNFTGGNVIAFLHQLFRQID